MKVSNLDTFGKDVEVLTVTEVAEKLGKSPQSIRIALQRGLLPFGTALKMPGSGRYVYIIYPEKVREYLGE